MINAYSPSLIIIEYLETRRLLYSIHRMTIHIGTRDAMKCNYVTQIIFVHIESEATYRNGCIETRGNNMDRIGFI